MKVTIQECSAEEEEEVIIRCRGIDERISRLLKALQSDQEKLTVFDGEKMHQVQLRDICYFEAVDNRVFAYLDTKVFEIHSKLYELEQQYGNADFFRVSKSVIVNLSKVDHFSPMFQGRMDACMTNKEHVVISRQYVSLLKVRLGLKKLEGRRNMTKFEFVLNKFYEITAWSLFAAVAMTVLNGDYDTVPASLLWQIPVLSFLGALSSLIYPWDRSMTRKEFVIRIAIHYLIMNGIGLVVAACLAGLIFMSRCRLL
ncbi:MAG: LytTR family DNA-binding domain-containing protein [Lachnospiraceae bacterium]